MSLQARDSDSDTLSILIVEDSADHTALLTRAFKASALAAQLTCVETLGDAREALRQNSVDVVLADMRLPDGTGTDLLQDPADGVPLVLMTSFGDEAQAVAAIKGGALDYVVKHENVFADLPGVCLRAARDWRAREERESARRALIASENRYRTLFENVPAGVFQCDHQGAITMANAALARMLGYGAGEDLSGLNLVRDLIMDSSPGRHLLKHLASASSVEVGLRRSDGSEALAILSMQQVREQGGTLCYEGFILNVTEQRAADAELAETRLRLEAAFQNLLGFIVFTDSEGRVLDVSESALEATGVSREALFASGFAAAPWWADIDGESQAVRAGLAAASAGQQTRDQARFMTADGKIHIADRSFTPVLDHAGQVRFIVVEGRDISDLVEASRKLEQREAEFRNLFENASEAIVVLDVENNGFIDLNRNAEHLFEASKNELLGRNPLDLSPAIQPNRDLSSESALAKIQAAVAGQPVVFEWMHTTTRGKEVPCEVRLSRLPHESRVLVRGSITDISERKAAEIKLREQQQRMSSLVENATSGILEIDVDGAVLSANPAAVAMLGHNHFSELVGKKFIKHVAPEERERTAEALASAWDGRDTSLVYPLIREAGGRTLASTFVAIRAADAAVARVMLMCDDITERFAHAQQLEEEQKFTDAVINSLPDTFFVYSEDGRLIRFNERLLEASGYSESEVRDMGPLAFFDEKNQVLVAAAMNKLFAEGEARTEAVMTRKDGGKVAYAFNGCLLEQHGQRFMVGVGVDITERRRNEQRVLAEQKFSETVINSMPGVFYVVNEQRRIVRWNQNLLDILGVSEAEIPELGPMSRIVEEDRERVAATIKQVFVEGAGETEARFIAADQRKVPFLLTGRRLRIRGETFMIGMGFDISERRHYEAQLKASENYLRSVIESEPECVWTLDRLGRLTDINPAGRSMLGPETVKYLGSNPVASLVAAEHRQAFERLNESVFAGQSGILTFKLETRDGARRWLETHAVALRNERGEIDGHLAVTRDITAKRLADRQIREYSERLQDLSKRLLEIQESERRHLARELHDEVGQSLTALKLDLEASRRAHAETDDRLLDSLEIVNHILVQVRDMSLDLRPAILDDLGLLPALRWYVDRQGKRAEIETTLEADTLTGVRLDSEVETAAFRIVQEALTNAMRHSGASNVDIRLTLVGERIEIAVHDDGVGFDAGAQLQRASHGRSFGLLGLSERAALLGGKARIESSPGAGARVAAWLPLREEPGDVREVRTGQAAV